ncbi:flavin-containing monooxygenase [Streptomyces griseomycini]|uniref:Flavoprotein involved in K+ transport n=1 Tax=Streptomyces griseomycini TaxID=66895 RepID=A0A7W7LZH3_9ACTN|nr:NAD(P)/FAD-dependent oxidoreductase [Streptomyces griseomycini]MBB4898897.1 putative flavoprotein involved in K+ transport [Streptomyces griseomycini]GGQ04773.1 oxidoreductase [Streptomyces griseomycini]GGR17802.1 oxidoreductase [Streptomyces griseomycini]
MSALPATVPVAVVGAGQSGLAAGYYLRQAGIRCVLLDAGSEVGETWQRRWDSLTLFTSAQFSGLPGLPFPGHGARYPGKDEVVAYLRDYAERFDLPVLTDHRVLSLRRDGDGYLLTTAHGDCRADRVVIATGAFGTPRVPEFAAGLSPDVPALHTSDYRGPAQVPPGTVVIVGDGNSGRQIAVELAGTHDVVLSCSDAVSPPLPQTVLGRDMFWWMSVLGVMSLPVNMQAPDPVVGDRVPELVAEGRIRTVGRITAAEGAELLVADGERVKPSSVIWATGYRTDWGWLDPEMLDDSGQPRHTEGTGALPGSYYLGLYRMRTRGSALIGFVGRDAERVVAAIAAAHGTTTASPTAEGEPS